MRELSAPCASGNRNDIGNPCSANESRRFGNSFWVQYEALGHFRLDLVHASNFADSSSINDERIHRDGGRKNHKRRIKFAWVVFSGIRGEPATDGIDHF